MVSEVLIICGTIGLLVDSNEFGGGMIILGVIGAILRTDDISESIKNKVK